jgi:predicted RNA-binding protein with RPS1 domain
MSETNLHLGAEVAGIVAAIQQYYATVQLDGQLGMAIVHISQLSNAFLPPPMSDHLSTGDRLSGLVVAVDRRTGYPEISPKKVRRFDALDLTGVQGNTEDCKVVKANEFYTVVETSNGPGLLTNLVGPWSRYEVLLASGLLSEGQSLALIDTLKLDESGRREMRFPIFPAASEVRRAKLLSGEMALWRPDATRKKDEMLRNIIYVHIGNGYLVRVECNDLLDITEHFSIGEVVQVRLTDRRPLREIPFGTLERGENNRQQMVQKLHIGEKVTGKVMRLLPGGAVVLIADYCWVYLPATTVMPGKGFIGKILQCGDVLEGVVTEGPKPDGQAKAGNGVISFSRLIEPSAVSSQYRDPLIDLTAQRKTAVRGGFAREAAFRLSVLEANAHTCCFCGQNFSIGGASPMEAAHIIPRAKRGSDTVSNGLCLCPMHHWAFDRGLWSLDESMVVRVASAVRDQSCVRVDWLANFHGKPATFPLGVKASLEAIDWHYRNIFDDDDIGLPLLA